jgi:hypothetical protein
MPPLAVRERVFGYASDTSDYFRPAFRHPRSHQPCDCNLFRPRGCRPLGPVTVGVKSSPTRRSKRANEVSTSFMGCQPLAIRSRF